MKTILLKFAGPLQSWGTSSHFETRYTDRYPSKSGVVGMIAASLGYSRNDDIKIKELNNLEFAVRVDQEGSLLRDYHIATKYKPNGNFERTYVTNRYYLQDALFIVAIGSANHDLIDMIENGLKRPYYQQFLGRRSLPLTADFFIKTCESGVVESLKNLPWQAAKWYKTKNNSNYNNVLSVYADSYISESESTYLVRDYVESFSQNKRVHDFRSVSKFQISIANDPEDNENRG
ncbi:MAG: type I-E CRISPR-associated protein Cas5/CasD [Clostridiaceae bacterium]